MISPHKGPSRRRFLRQGVAAFFLLGPARPLRAGPVPRLEKGVPYHWNALVDRARVLASVPFASQAAAPPIHQWIERLHAHHPGGIHMIEQAFLGAANDAPFRVEGLYPDNRQRKATALYLVDEGKAHQWIFRGNQFDYGDAAVATNAPQNLFYGGMALWLPGDKAPFAIFDGKGMFSVAVVPGEFNARSAIVEINPTLPNARDTLRTRAIYIHKPLQRWAPLVVDVLLDSAELTGAVRMSIVRDPDGKTRVHHDQSWFVRDALTQLGLAPQFVRPVSSLACTTSMAMAQRLQRAMQPRPINSGVCLVDDKHQQIWRPLSIAKQSTLTVFDTRKPLGFGVLRRIADSANSPLFSPARRETFCWTVPQGTWPDGHLQLIEAPESDDSYRSSHPSRPFRASAAPAAHAHLVWVPTTEVMNTAGTALNVRYRQDWMLDVESELTSKLQVCDSRFECHGDGRSRQLRVTVFFSGGMLARRGSEDEPDNGLQARVHAGRGDMTDPEIRMLRSDGDLVARLSFNVLTTGPEPVGLRAQLTQAGSTVSEIWLFTYLPSV